MKHSFLFFILLFPMVVLARKVVCNGSVLSKECNFIGHKCGTCRVTYSLLYNEPGFPGLWLQINNSEVQKNPQLQQLLRGSTNVRFAEPLLISPTDRRALGIREQQTVIRDAGMVIQRNDGYYIKLNI